MTGRVKLGYELNQSNAYSLRDATPHLMGQSFDPEKEYFEFLIKGKITPDNLRALLTLPCEVSLGGEPNLVLSTGHRASVAQEEDIWKRLNDGKIYFHIHPYYAGKFQGSPSLGDIMHSFKVKDDITLSLAHAGGILIYRRPSLDPATKKLVNSGEDFFSILKKYATFNRIWVEDREIPEEAKDQYDKRLIDFDQREFFRFTREFSEQTGMIVDEARWEDKEGIERVVAKAFAGINK